MRNASPHVFFFLPWQEGVEVRVARIFNTFGSRMHMNDGRVVSNFILQALQGEPLTVRMPPPPAVVRFMAAASYLCIGRGGGGDVGP